MTEPNKERQAKLDAAAELYKIYGGGLSTRFLHEVSDYEQLLIKAAEKAKKDLDDYRISKAMHLALDSMLPGWKYIDATDWLPREKWRTFVSNDRKEWESWLKRNDVPFIHVKEQLDRAFGKVEK